MSRLTTSVVAAAFAAWLSGCSSGPAAGTVKGVVTFDGQPVKGGQVSLLPNDGKTYAAEIDPQTGAYRVENVPLGEAVVIVHPPPVVVPGEVLKKMTGPAPPQPPPPFPARYSDPKASRLKHTVVAGESTFHIPMTK